MLRYSLRTIFVIITLIAIEAALTRNMATVVQTHEAPVLVITWLLYGMLLGGVSAVWIIGRDLGALTGGVVVGGFGQILI
jgi:hypothetical protein